MTFYKCDCGVAHGNVHGPWFDNQCPNCKSYPSFIVNGYTVKAVKENEKFIFSYLSKIINDWILILEPTTYRYKAWKIKAEIFYQEQYLNMEKSLTETKRRDELDGVKYSGYIKPTPEEAATGITGWIVREPVNVDEVILSRKAVQSSVATSQVAGGFINITGGSGPIFPYGDLPEVGMIQECELEPQACTCDTFLLMQSGCKCGFFEREQRTKSAQEN